MQPILLNTILTHIKRLYLNQTVYIPDKFIFSGSPEFIFLQLRAKIRILVSYFFKFISNYMEIYWCWFNFERSNDNEAHIAGIWQWSVGEPLPYRTLSPPKVWRDQLLSKTYLHRFKRSDFLSILSRSSERRRERLFTLLLYQFVTRNPGECSS